MKNNRIFVYLIAAALAAISAIANSCSSRANLTDSYDEGGATPAAPC